MVLSPGLVSLAHLPCRYRGFYVHDVLYVSRRNAFRLPEYCPDVVVEPALPALSTSSLSPSSLSPVQVPIKVVVVVVVTVTTGD